ncbi:MAG: DUF4296 domain-containing protein [Bacteroidota bacterium]|nr:DUF4296 domain-containing protein [Bacteroidota bacterium]
MRFFRGILIILLITTFFACHKRDRKVNVDIIPPKKMVEVIYDVHQVEAKLNMEQIKGRNITSLSKEYYNSLFKKHDLTKEEFEKSIEYYAERPAEFEEIYTKVINKFNTVQ